MSSISDVNSMAGSLQSSIDAAVKRLQTQAQTAQIDKPANVQTYQQDVRKSSYNFTPFATNIGVLVKDTSRLNVMSSLAANDPADFYKVSVTSDGNMTLGQVGDSGVRFQLMDKTGNVLADSDSGAGDAYANYKKLQNGEYPATKGDYTVRVSRASGESPTTSKDYAFQLLQGTYSKDYDTIARQPDTSTTGGASYLDILRQSSDNSTTSGPLAMLAGGTPGLVDSSSALSLLDGTNTPRGSLVDYLF